MDILDDDLDLGYTPTMMGNSRAASMKKITKKQTKSSTPKPNTSLNARNKSQFDDLLDDLFEKQDKSKSKNKKTSNEASFSLGKNENKSKFENVDSFFDEPSTQNISANRNNSPKSNKNANNLNLRTSILNHNSSHEDLIVEDSAFPSVNFGKTQQTIINTSRAEQTLISTRHLNMKPPLRKKQSQINVSQGLGLVLEEELTSSNKNESDVIKPPPRLGMKRSSFDQRNQKNIESIGLTLEPDFKGSTVSQFNISEHKKQKQEPFFMTLNKLDKKQSITQQKKKEVLQPKKKEVLQAKKEIFKVEKQNDYHLDMPIDQSITMMKQTKSNNSYDYEKEIEHLKSVMQKQIKCLQQNLEQQISTNRETRERIMNESNKIIEEERIRSAKMHREEIEQMQKIFDWEKKRVEDSFQHQIASLRQSLDYASKTINVKATTNSTQHDTHNIEYQLKLQNQLVQEKQKLLNARELELEQRQFDFNSRRRGQEDRLKKEESKLMQEEMRIKRQNLEAKRQITQEKQQLAMEMAQMEMELIKKNEKAELINSELQMQRAAVEKEKNQFRLLNKDVLNKYKIKMDQIQFEKERVQHLEMELIKKLRVVEMKAKDIQIQNTSSNHQNLNKTALNIHNVSNKQLDNWVHQENQEQIRSNSVEKQNSHEKHKKYQTQKRFYELEQSMKKNERSHLKQNKKFDLDTYIMTVENYTRQKLSGQ